MPKAVGGGDGITSIKGRSNMPLASPEGLESRASGRRRVWVSTPWRAWA